MSGLLLIVSKARGQRLATAFELAASLLALDKPVSLLLKGEAVAGLDSSGLQNALQMLLEMGAEICACQTSMAQYAVYADSLPKGVEPAGMIAFLAGRTDWQIQLI